ncbi:MAG: hypothetical protein B7733_18540 [Myxococcales bacterium FL481]|nr:MAG: hypothetical protein B7733_18540 [Myxococcales bacterium FL481]
MLMNRPTRRATERLAFCLGLVAGACRATGPSYTPIRLAQDPVRAEAVDPIAVARVVTPLAAASCDDDDGCVELLLVFTEPLAAETLGADDVLLMFEDGTRALAYDLGFGPASERDENSSVWGTFPDAGHPVAVQVIGSLYDEHGLAQRGARAEVRHRTGPPAVVQAKVSRGGPNCAASSWGVRLVFDERIVVAKSHALAQPLVALASGDTASARFEPDELVDGDNVVDLCSEHRAAPRAVMLPAGALVDVRGQPVSASPTSLDAIDEPGSELR